MPNVSSSCCCVRVACRSNTIQREKTKCETCYLKTLRGAQWIPVFTLKRMRFKSIKFFAPANKKVQLWSSTSDMRNDFLIVWTFVVDQYAWFLRKVQCTMRDWARNSIVLQENAVEVVVTKARTLRLLHCFFYCLWNKQTDFETQNPVDFSSRVFFWKMDEKVSTMIWTKVPRMMVDEQCCVPFDLCCSTAFGRQLRARAAPDLPPPAAQRSAPPFAALRPRALRRCFGEFPLLQFLQHVSALCYWVFFLPAPKPGQFQV